jgi:hypothetical protein
MPETVDKRTASPSALLESLPSLSAASRRLLDPAMSAWEFLERLRSENLLQDAVLALTHVLPRPYAIAWACECWQAARTDAEPDPAERSAIAATRRWLAEPTEENRRAALELADRLGYSSSAALLAAAAGWSGGSMLPPDLPASPPSAGMSGQAVKAAVLLAAAADPARFDDMLKLFVDNAVSTFAPSPK